RVAGCRAPAHSGRATPTAGAKGASWCFLAIESPVGSGPRGDFGLNDLWSQIHKTIICENAFLEWRPWQVGPLHEYRKQDRYLGIRSANHDLGTDAPVHRVERCRGADFLVLGGALFLCGATHCAGVGRGTNAAATE